LPSDFQQEFIKETKRQKVHIEEMEQPTEPESDVVGMLELPDQEH
jgi:hypothetical protein